MSSTIGTEGFVIRMATVKQEEAIEVMKRVAKMIKLGSLSGAGVDPVPFAFKVEPGPVQ